MQIDHGVSRWWQGLTVAVISMLIAGAIGCGDSITAPSDPVPVAAFDGPRNGEFLIVEFTGTVNEGTLILPPDLEGIIAPGGSVKGRFILDPTIPDASPDSTIGVYTELRPGYGMSLTIGGAHLESDPHSPRFTVQVMDDHIFGIAPDGMDRFGLMSFANTPLLPSTVVPTVFQIFLSDPSKNAFDTDALPALPLDLTAFKGTMFAVGRIATLIGESPRVSVGFDIDTMTLVEHVYPLTVSFYPRSLRLHDRSLWLAVRLQVAATAPSELDPASLRLVGGVGPSPDPPFGRDRDRDGILEDWFLLFPRFGLDPYLNVGMHELKLEGRLRTGELVRGWGQVSVRRGIP